jgi:hypothetical protein
MNIITAVITAFIYLFGNQLGLYGAVLLHELGLL